ncbi:cardiolipin synthase [Reinekea marinisedimentorum]|uniref:Cardiolipin synthase n=1 Tax=Reinekea marinisedimentorum TaxID=230495 RepID=A0A4R3HZ20_9GAMM|nr:cardiolipin synthase [Reinekea marinisedimentorum]TCS38124.1 cardiolipin synthase [Reinekea marinisedimentorum]
MHWDWLLSIGAGFYTAAVVALSLRILMKRRPVGVTLAWLLFLFILPVLGIIFYLLFGERYIGRIRAKRARNQYQDYSKWLERTLQKQNQYLKNNKPLRPVMELAQKGFGLPVIGTNKWRLISHANELFRSLISDLQSARQVVFIEFYILEDEGGVHEVLSAMTEAAKRGVQVHLMLDSVGSGAFLKSKRCSEMIKQGVKILEVLHAYPFRLTLRRQDLRQHRKLITIDNQIAYTGSMNLVDPEFFKTRSGVGPWIDLMARLEGDIAKVTQAALIFDWEMETGTRLEKYLAYPTLANNCETLMQLLPTGPAFNDEILLQVLLTTVHNARRQITLTTPYFVPDDSLLQALKAAARRGLDVTIIVPKKNDSKLAQLAGRSFYEDLLTAGVKIQRYVGGLLHTKTVIIDRDLVLLGSVNLDMRSIWLNFESTLIVDDAEFCAEVQKVVDDYSKNAELIDLASWVNRPAHRRLLENIAQLASPLL